MDPIAFSCLKYIPKPAGEICAEILNLERWPEFTGYGVLPGIEKATFERRTTGMVGTRIRVENTDGSTHVEEITAWVLGKQVILKLHEFSPPLRHIATHFSEEWGFTGQDGGTLVTRTFQMYPRHALTRPFLSLISLLFKRAVDRHLQHMAEV